ncbi:MAG: STELLO glycosyltransferase family protein, partial [Stellaceae bacterium]
FWSPRRRRVDVPAVEGAGWLNVYRYFSDDLIWPRGLPLDAIHTPVPDFTRLQNRAQDCPVQQGLANDNPDVDAIFRLTSPGVFTFRHDRRVALGSGTWCPFNSQNTTCWYEAFPLLYLPSYCSFRMTDIWRSFVAQRICWENSWSVLFHEPTVRQERNAHDLMRDFADEQSGYLNNRKIAEIFAELPMKRGVRSIPDNMRMAYGSLIEAGLVNAAELQLLDLWFCDLAAVGVL